AFLVTADVPEIYMQEFRATTKLRHNSMRFKKDTGKSVLDLEAFREMLHISPRIPSQSFAEFPFEEEILEFLRHLGHSDEIRHLTDVNPSIPRRNKINWHYVMDDVLFSTIKVVSRHQTTQQYDAILSIELTTDDIRNKEPVQTTCQMEEPSHSVFETGADDQPIVQTSQHPEWFSQPRRPPSPNRGSCNSLTELEYHLEEVYKATTDQLDWVNPEGQQYPHNLLQPLPLIPDNRGRRVIPFEHFINNDLEYLRGGASSRKYTTSVTKTKATDYGHIKWIEDLVPRVMWIQEPINYDRHALWEVSLWGQKRQQFYGFAVNQESTLDVYSKRRIIAVSCSCFGAPCDVDTGADKLRQACPLGSFSLGAETSAVLWDKKNRLMRIDELHKFSDGTLNDVRNALDDHLNGIRMQYLPTTIWRRGDKDRAAAMIQVIDKMLKTRRIMRSLEKFVGGRLYEGDFRMLQRTI
nr:hypothetical protein [Tanacetum cinerariifolium]